MELGFDFAPLLDDLGGDGRCVLPPLAVAHVDDDDQLWLAKGVCRGKYALIPLLLQFEGDAAKPDMVELMGAELRVEVDFLDGLGGAAFADELPFELDEVAHELGLCPVEVDKTAEAAAMRPVDHALHPFEQDLAHDLGEENFPAHLGLGLLNQMLIVDLLLAAGGDADDLGP